MMLFIYADSMADLLNYIKRSIELAHPDITIRHYHSLDHLKNRLRKPGMVGGIGILLTANEKELKELFDIRGYLYGINIILLISPDGNSVYYMAHQLRPRHICVMDEAIAQEILSVSDKLLSRIGDDAFPDNQH